MHKEKGNSELSPSVIICPVSFCKISGSVLEVSNRAAEENSLLKVNHHWLHVSVDKTSLPSAAVFTHRSLPDLLGLAAVLVSEAGAMVNH